ncbi:MAG: helix-turn-helix transcriptional regulator [Bacteroidales bacterium]|nr:helix-turn-helix transcriptional regulator [Bacteroidales bacterium]
MRLEYHIPAMPLRAFIKLYAFYSIEKERKISPIKFIPMGLPYVVFNLEDCFFIDKSNLDKMISTKGSVITGQMVNHYYLLPQGNLTSLSVIFQPAGMFRLLHAPMHELIDYGYPAEDVLRDKLTPLYEKMLAANGNLSLMIRTLDAFFLAQLAKSDNHYAYIEYALHRIHDSTGLVTIPQLLERVCTSDRTFRRRFRECVGVSCKTYISLTRLNHIMNAVKNQRLRDINWCRIACNSGYYDQMHFIKAFKRFCGENPTDFINRYHDPDHASEKYFLSASE